jgi:hypothetical protein
MSAFFDIGRHISGVSVCKAARSLPARAQICPDEDLGSVESRSWIGSDHHAPLLDADSTPEDTPTAGGCPNSARRIPRKGCLEFKFVVKAPAVPPKGPI